MKGKSRFLVDPMLDELVDHLFANRKSFYQDDEWIFDYPDYGGLPKKIANRLSSDVVDKLQCYLEELCKKRSKKSFEKEIVPLVVEDFI